MDKELITRIEKILETYEALEHRISILIEGQRMHLSNVVSDLRLPEMRHELRNIMQALKK